jgi:uncharacterized protein (DUF1778 family)
MSNTTRITARVTPQIQELLSKAVAISGVTSINSFILSAAIDKAKDIIAKESMLNLTQKDTMLFLDAIENPKSNKKLKDAFIKYNS